MLLNEYKRNFFRLLNEGAAEMYRDSYYPEIDDYILEKIIEIDPESNGDDLSDFGKLLLKLNPQMSDFEQLKKDIEIFAKAVRNGAEVPDVKTVEELHYAAVDLANSNAHMSGDEVNAQEESLGCPTVYSDGDYRVIDICNKDAAAYYGKGTMWIWGANDGNMFDQYSQRGKIYVILKGSEKFSAIRMGSRLRITDAQDENVSKDMFPQEMLTALTGVNESKNVRLTENELMDMLVEAVENKILNNNNNNMAKVKLTESRLKKMISEAVKKAINEIAINDAYTKFYQDIPQEDFDKIVSTLQSGNDNLLPETKWVLNLYKRDSSVMMDLPKVNNIIKFFNRAKQRGMIKGMEGDLNRYKSISELGRFVNSLKMDDVMSPTRSEVRNYNNTNGKNEIETVYQDGEWQVIIPKTFAASCYWGKGTSWDTAHRIQGERYFDYYSNMSPLYIFVNKQTGEKYQYHNEVGLIDSNDHEVNPQEVGLSEILDEITGNGIRESRKRKTAINEIMTGGYITFAKDIKYKDNNWTVVVPSSFESACAWSEGATWDTANKNEGPRYFEYYTQKSPLYIFINRQTNDKYQYHEEVGLFDSNDYEVNPQEVGLGSIFDKVVNGNLSESRKRNKRNKR